MNACTRCLLPEGKLNVTLDQDNLCNYCTYFDRQEMIHPEHTDRRALLRKKLRAYKGDYEHDVLIGLSGGKDSTYVAYRLVKDYDVRVLSMTYDNGFLTDRARKNTSRITDRLGLDHFYHTPDWDAHSVLYRAAFEKLGDPCVACGFAGYFLSIKLCFDLKIPFFVHGRSPYQMYRNYREGSGDVFITMNQANLALNSFGDVAKLYREVYTHVLQSIDLLVDDPEKRRSIQEEFFVHPDRLNEEFAPEFVGFFLFEPYREDEMRSALEKEQIGKPQKTHSDCAVHEAADYLFREIHGISLETAEVAAMLRFGSITQEEADDILSNGIQDGDSLDRAIGEFCARTGISRPEFESRVKELQHNGSVKFDSH